MGFCKMRNVEVWPTISLPEIPVNILFNELMYATMATYSEYISSSVYVNFLWCKSIIFGTTLFEAKNCQCPQRDHCGKSVANTLLFFICLYRW